MPCPKDVWVRVPWGANNKQIFSNIFKKILALVGSKFQVKTAHCLCRLHDPDKIMFWFAVSSELKPLIFFAGIA